MDAWTSRPRAATDARRRLTRLPRAMWTSLNTAVRSWRTDRSEVRRLVEERGALQHVAALVARGAPPSVIFQAAASALARSIKADYTAINRRETDQTMSNVTFWHAPGVPRIDLPFGERWPLGDDVLSAAALRCHKPAGLASETEPPLDDTQERSWNS